MTKKSPVIKLLGPIIIVSLLLSSSACRYKKPAEVDAQEEVQEKEKKGVKRLWKGPKKTIDPYIRYRYYDPEERMKNQTIRTTITELVGLNPLKDKTWINNLAGNLKEFGDEAVEAVAMRLESAPTLREKVVLLKALEVMNPEVAKRYIPVIMDEVAKGGAKSFRYLGPIFDRVKSRPGFVKYLKDIYYSSDDTELHKKVIVALSRVDDDEASETLYEIAQQNNKLTPMAIKAMSRIKTHETAERLVTMLVDPKMKKNRTQLVEMIKKLKEYAGEPLVYALKNVPQKDRSSTIRLISEIGGPDVLEELGYYYRTHSRSDLKKDEKRQILRIFKDAKVPNVSEDVGEDALNDKDIEIKRDAISLLSECGSSRALIILRAYGEKAGPLKLQIAETIKRIERKQR